ncbi:hypothetical protein O3P69_007884 [Scylla paramamosain]|uniref:Uncharacterized protein n=1 Tax=Scylla paramamosain TaxID=85552 RepID=A0AAW0SGZ5_SCYPA
MIITSQKASLLFPAAVTHIDNIFMDRGSLSEVSSLRKDNKDDSYMDDALNMDDEEFVSIMKRRIDPDVLNADNGPIVSGSTLLNEIKILAELFIEETESEEKTGGEAKSVAPILENSDDECQTTALLASSDIARSRAPPNPLLLPSDAPKRIYESLLGSNDL